MPPSALKSADYTELLTFALMTYPNTISGTIPEFLEQTVVSLRQIPTPEWEKKPDPHRWSKKEILGHLIDSATTNIRRLVVTQYEVNDRITYRQNEWVAFSAYQDAPVEDLITLWRLINLHYHRVASKVPNESLNLTCNTSNGEPQLRTLEFLITDYWGHQQHHLRQISEG